jgi:hypothetical protein
MLFSRCLVIASNSRKRPSVIGGSADATFSNGNKLRERLAKDIRVKASLTGW